MAALRDGVLLERRFDVATMDVVFILRPPGTDGLAARTSPGSMVVQLGPYPAVIVGTRIQGSASPDEVEGVMNVFQTLDTTGGLGRAIAGEFLPPPVAQPTVDSAASGGAPLAAPIAEPIAAAPTVDDVTTKIDAEAGTTASAVGTEPTPSGSATHPPRRRSPS
jgi:predicted component of type VI protein secretion system